MTTSTQVTTAQAAGRPESGTGATTRVGRPRIVIVGAGFGGLSAARALAGKDVEVLLIDRNNYHGFWPLLYQVATAGLEPESIAYPVRAIFRGYPNVDFRLSDVQGVELRQRRVLTDGEPISYDYLILAAGSANNYFGNDDLAHATLALKDIDEAERLRNRVLASFERAAGEANPDRRAALMTVAVIGGGPTGVELAGALSELIRTVLRHDYPGLDLRQARVLLIEATTELLTPFQPSSRQAARARLERMGVELHLGQPVAAVHGQEITLKDGTVFQANTVAWTAGVRAAQLADTLGVAQGRGARVKVSPGLNLAEHPEVFVVGDMAYHESEPDGAADPMLAPAAMQQGRLAADNVLRLHQRRPLRRFRYRDWGMMATIGRGAAVAELYGLAIEGRVAWLAWLFVHLMQLVGFRNRVVVFANWIYNYATYDRGVRLITHD
jgi:NADH:quinone reductase (non-electrogenic)